MRSLQLFGPTRPRHGIQIFEYSEPASIFTAEPAAFILSAAPLPNIIIMTWGKSPSVSFGMGYQKNSLFIFQ